MRPRYSRGSEAEEPLGGEFCVGRCKLLLIYLAAEFY